MADDRPVIRPSGGFGTGSRAGGLLVLYAGLLILPGCEEGPGSRQSAIVRDSAGVTIIENPEDVWSEAPRWQVSSDPVVRIGAVERPAEYLFGHIADLVVLSDGRIVVAEGQNRTLRWFAHDGEFLFQAGGLGEGPGEISSFSGVALVPGDTILVRDGPGGRLVSFASDGTHVGTTRPRGLAGSASGRVYRIADGSHIMARVGPGPSRASPEPEPGLIRIPATVLRVARDGDVIDTLGVFHGPEREIHRRDGTPAIDAPYFGRGFSHTVADDQLYVGTQEPFEINVFSPEGDWVRSIRAPSVDTRLGPERIGAFRDWMLGRLEGLPSQRRAELTSEFDATLGERLLPEHEPAYSTFLHDPSGNLWVAEYRFELNLHPPERWAVFDREGRFLSAVIVPPDFTLMAATEDRVFGRWRDGMDVQYVAAYRIERP